MTARMQNNERFHNLMNFKEVDRICIIEWATWWDKTITRWYGEGLPPWDPYDDEGIEIMKYFGLDMHREDWLWPRAASHRFAAEAGEGFGITTMDAYEKILPHLYPANAVDKYKWNRWAQEQERGEIVTWINLEGFFWHPRILMGIERHMYAFYDCPELIHRMNEDNVAFMLNMIEQVSEICKPDFMTFAEDMTYNHGPMLSKQFFDEFIKPYYRKVMPILKEKGILAFVDSDGQIEQIAPWFQEIGLDGMLPLERQAGVDVVSLRKLYPEIRLIGGFDKTVMTHGEDAMRKEFERLLPVMRQGGFIPSCDHQTPSNVSLEQYKMYVKLLSEYCESAMR